MIVEEIKREFRIKLSKTSVGRLLHQLGFSCQKPLYRAYQRDTALVEQWKKQGARFGLNMIGAISPGGDLYFMIQRQCR